ncbi:LD-carboxypeptidase [Curtobacterium sp. MCLR17_032]|uniref:LD-carboxypeptidase n=1 Tax=Curtobacterium sp. MCLR17_032 TaxID=2175650 RepID=UPI0032E8C0FA
MLLFQPRSRRVGHPPARTRGPRHCRERWRSIGFQVPGSGGFRRDHAHPKPTLGYSDISLLHLALYSQTGLVGW